jgi:hypothetical protein
VIKDDRTNMPWMAVLAFYGSLAKCEFKEQRCRDHRRSHEYRESQARDGRSGLAGSSNGRRLDINRCRDQG